jgi:ankyrin repeat protein
MHGMDVRDMKPAKIDLCALVQSGSLDKIRQAIDAGADVNAQTEFGFTPLILAAVNGHADVCMLLIENKADVNAVDKDGFTPLIFAAVNGHADVCRLLIENKADMNVQNKWRDTALILAARKGHAGVAELIVRALLLSEKQKSSIVSFIGCLKKRNGRSRDESTLLGKWLVCLERAKNYDHALSQVQKVPDGAIKTRLLEIVNNG